eukprot:CAMPEP_0118640558 /NCGR_PEP_ID=MMETSP0785-20121206/4817_1 /TAXON_ID=91992 /ORGANISM="Bolidomonas pacifica, Strain CCMP 1866" /LENGTH=221 /DNA_ID=CAMNT_0006531953 /DNA_START=27 /DNA_END=689 /DNA_ORIENTATION=-
MAIPSSSSVVNVGCIGVGSVCEIKSLPGIYKNPRVSVVALARRDEAALSDYVSRHPMVSSSTLFTGSKSGKDLISFMTKMKEEDEGGNQYIVYVATPVSTHASMAELCGENGLHCYCEKPLSLDSQSCQTLLPNFTTSNLYCAYYRRYLPKFVSIKTIGLPKIGEVTGVMVTLRQRRHKMDEDRKRHWHFDKEVSGGGLVMDLGSHVFDIVDHLLGPMLDV